MVSCGLIRALCRGGSYEAPGETSGRSGESFGGMMQRVGSGALSPKAIMNSITSKGNEFLQGRRGPGILNNDVRSCLHALDAEKCRCHSRGLVVTLCWMLGPLTACPNAGPHRVQQRRG